MGKPQQKKGAKPMQKMTSAEKKFAANERAASVKYTRGEDETLKQALRVSYTLSFLPCVFF